MTRFSDYSAIKEFKKDPYNEFRKLLSVTSSIDSINEQISDILKLLTYSDSKDDFGMEGIYKSKLLKKHCPNIWPKIHNLPVFKNYSSKEDFEQILNNKKLEFNSDNQWVALLSGFIILLEEIIYNSSAKKPSLRNSVKESNPYSKILDLDKFWDFNYSEKAAHVLKTCSIEQAEIKEKLNGFDNWIDKGDMKSYRIQNSFMMLCFKAIQ